MRTRSDDLSATERCKAVEAAHRRPDGSAAGASTARTGSEVVRPRPAGSTLRWGFWGSARHLHVTSTCRRRGSAPRLHFTLAAPALISMLLRPHETHLIARVAQSRPESVPSSSSEVTRSPSIAHSSACRRGQRPSRSDLWRKGARKDEPTRSLERGVGSTDGMEGLHRLQLGR